MGGGFAVPKKPAGWNRVRAAGLNLGKEEFAKGISAQNGWGCRQHLVEVEMSSSHGLQQAAHVVFVGGDKVRREGSKAGGGR